MMEKITRVLGLKDTSLIRDEDDPDPDPSYILTSDNLIKILAIQMRFRY